MAETKREIAVSGVEIGLRNVEYLRQEGEVSPIILNAMAAVYGVGRAIGKLRERIAPRIEKEPENSQRNAAVSL